MSEQDEAVLKALAAIVDEEETSPGYKKRQDYEEFVHSLMTGFGIPRRQAVISGEQIRGNFIRNAERRNTSAEEYYESLSPRGSMAIIAFCIGTVLQNDILCARDPETGDHIEPEYSI